ncbi:hypothetical protein LY28_01440 [Ruminiclostridium sufflavum DSM 19573]|uniref:Uncharacterized protein n=1 Tax=Ruminiclostridium sufflavum DSM 19573 TaxID=1121337 RepID=A0A318XNS0_9FIRM|nr:hypothetical protein [Ruminiclostridium sufflavum]PYG88589.1 hypothetical protein LY28_01440 [Ruminiclostridium sufflavum DSM 19573]
MRWEGLIDNNTAIPDIERYKEKLGQISIENIRIYDAYNKKLEAYKANMFKDFKRCLSNGFVIEKRGEKNISAKSPQITLTLWEEKGKDNSLVLNFRKADGKSWRFVLYIEPIEKKFERLTEDLGWYVDQEGKLETFKDEIKNLVFYKSEFSRAEKLIKIKRSIYREIDDLNFKISLWHNNNLLDNFLEFEDCLYKAVELS